MIETAQATPSSNRGNVHKSTLIQVERELLKQALEATDGNQTAASQMLGMRRATFDAKVREYRLK